MLGPPLDDWTAQGPKGGSCPWETLGCAVVSMTLTSWVGVRGSAKVRGLEMQTPEPQGLEKATPVPSFGALGGMGPAPSALMSLYPLSA